MLTGDNGILTQANNAKTANTQGGEKEQIQLAWQAVLAEKIKNNEERTINVDELKGQLEYDEAKVEEVVSEGENLKVTFESGNVYTVTQDGKVTLDGEEEPTPPTGGGSAGEIEGTEYGKPVTNYEVNGVTGWEIFYSDDKNIYLIADDYIHKSICPNSATQSIYDNGNGYKLSMNNVIKDYSNGPGHITDEKIKALNNDYFNVKNYTSTNNNMKAVAYMLDTGIWSGFAKAGVADYAIGGPTVEMLMKAYSEKNNLIRAEDGKYQYQARARNATGYEISWDYGETWNTEINTSSAYLKAEKPFVISSDSKASAMWLASPSADDSSYVMDVYCSGYVGGFHYSASVGFRPLVCLNSDVQLQKSEDGNSYTIVE